MFLYSSLPFLTRRLSFNFIFLCSSLSFWLVAIFVSASILTANFCFLHFHLSVLYIFFSVSSTLAAWLSLVTVYGLGCSFSLIVNLHFSGPLGTIKLLKTSPLYLVFYTWLCFLCNLVGVIDPKRYNHSWGKITVCLLLNGAHKYDITYDYSFSKSRLLTHFLKNLTCLDRFSRAKISKWRFYPKNIEPFSKKDLSTFSIAFILHILY